MKAVILNVILLLVSNVVFAKDYICRGAEGEPVIEIVELDEHTQFQYLVDGKAQLTLFMDKGTVQPVTNTPFAFDAGQTFTYRPGFGETNVHVYGKILHNRSVFDIFVVGMLGNVQRTLVNYDCSTVIVE